jgi:hypothetical protein
MLVVYSAQGCIGVQAGTNGSVSFDRENGGAPTVSFTSPTPFHYNYDLLYQVSVSFENEDQGFSGTGDASVWSGSAKIGTQDISYAVHVFGTGSSLSVAVVTTDVTSLFDGFELEAKSTIVEKAVPNTLDEKRLPALDKYLEKYVDIPEGDARWIYYVD